MSRGNNKRDKPYSHLVDDAVRKAELKKKGFTFTVYKKFVDDWYEGMKKEKENPGHMWNEEPIGGAHILPDRHLDGNPYSYSGKGKYNTQIDTSGQAPYFNGYDPVPIPPGRTTREGFGGPRKMSPEGCRNFFGNLFAKGKMFDVVPKDGMSDDEKLLSLVRLSLYGFSIFLVASFGEPDYGAKVNRAVMGLILALGVSLVIFYQLDEIPRDLTKLGDSISSPGVLDPLVQTTGEAVKLLKVASDGRTLNPEPFDVSQRRHIGGVEPQAKHGVRFASSVVERPKVRVNQKRGREASLGEKFLSHPELTIMKSGRFRAPSEGDASKMSQLPHSVRGGMGNSDISRKWLEDARNIDVPTRHNFLKTNDLFPEHHKGRYDYLGRPYEALGQFTQRGTHVADFERGYTRSAGGRNMTQHMKQLRMAFEANGPVTAKHFSYRSSPDDLAPMEQPRGELGEEEPHARYGTSMKSRRYVSLV